MSLVSNSRIIWHVDFNEPYSFSIDLSSFQILADDFARNGFKVYIPDLFEGDPIPANALNPVCHSGVISILLFRS
jgi:hypothetical protein